MERIYEGGGWLASVHIAHVREAILSGTFDDVIAGQEVVFAEVSVFVELQRVLVGGEHVQVHDLDRVFGGG